MKPTLITNRTGEKIPAVDFHYHSTLLSGCGAPCAKIASPSFHNISRDYFSTEAQHHFAAEAIVFGAMLATAAVPIISGAYAIIELCRGVAF